MDKKESIFIAVNPYSTGGHYYKEWPDTVQDTKEDYQKKPGLVFCCDCKYLNPEYTAGKNLGEYECKHDKNKTTTNDPISGKGFHLMDRPEQINKDMHCKWYEGK